MQMRSPEAYAYWLHGQSLHSILTWQVYSKERKPESHCFVFHCPFFCCTTTSRRWPYLTFRDLVHRPGLLL